MKETILKINKAKSWFFGKINKIDKSLAKTHQEKKRKEQNKKWKRRGYKRQCRNTKDYKTIMNNPITSTEIEAVIKKSPQNNKSPGPDSFRGEF